MKLLPTSDEEEDVRHTHATLCGQAQKLCAGDPRQENTLPATVNGSKEIRYENVEAFQISP